MIQVLDETDLRILRAMQADCRLTTKQLASQIHLSSTPTFERLRRLERMGFIRSYVAVLDAEKLERGFVVYCNVSMKQINKVIAEDWRQHVEGGTEVAECYNVSGNCDYMLKVYVESMKRYQEFHIEKVGQIDYVARIQSVFVMDTVMQTYGIPI